MQYWDEYYEYYINSNYNPNDVLIKCDDDVIYLDVHNFASFINEVKPNSGLYFPNIVNNDVCAYIQMKYGIHNLVSDTDIIPSYGNTAEPLGGWSKGWYTKYDRAAAVHTDFLRDPTRYSVQAKPVAWKGRISINMFAGKYQDIQHYFKLFMIHGNHDDEAFFSHFLYNYVSGSNYVVPFMPVAHFSFGPQNPNLLDNNFLGAYKTLSEKVAP